MKRQITGIIEGTGTTDFFIIVSKIEAAGYRLAPGIYSADGDTGGICGEKIELAASVPDGNRNESAGLVAPATEGVGFQVETVVQQTPIFVHPVGEVEYDLHRIRYRFHAQKFQSAGICLLAEQQAFAVAHGDGAVFNVGRHQHIRAGNRGAVYVLLTGRKKEYNVKQCHYGQYVICLEWVVFHEYGCALCNIKQDTYVNVYTFMQAPANFLIHKVSNRYESTTFLWRQLLPLIQVGF